MSAIHMRCLHCHSVYVAGVVGSTPWPEHICADGTRKAPAEFANAELSDWTYAQLEAELPPEPQEERNSVRKILEDNGFEIADWQPKKGDK